MVNLGDDPGNAAFTIFTPFILLTEGKMAGGLGVVNPLALFELPRPGICSTDTQTAQSRDNQLTGLPMPCIDLVRLCMEECEGSSV